MSSRKTIKKKNTPAVKNGVKTGRINKAGISGGLRYVLIGITAVAALVGLHFLINAAVTGLLESGAIEKIKNFRIKTGKEEIPKIHVKEAYKLFKKNKAVFIDARSAGEYMELHIKGAVSIPAGTGPDKIRELSDKFKGKILVTYCHGVGCHLSDRVANTLQGMGYKKIKNFFGGWNEWTQAGYPVEKYEPPEQYKRLFEEAVSAGDINEATLPEVKYLYDNGLANIIDADTQEKYNERHIDRTINVPLENLDAMLRNYLGLFVQKTLIVYCNNRDDRALTVAGRIYGAGAKKIYVYKGGLDAWEKAGYPLYKKQ